MPVWGGGKICRWLLLFQEYNFQVILHPGCLNFGLDHLSCIENGDDPMSLEKVFLDAQLFTVCIIDAHFANTIQYLSIGTTPE